MKLKKNFPTDCSTDDFWYDLFYGGSIDPNEWLVSKDADKVGKAIDLLMEFRDTIQRHLEIR